MLDPINKPAPAEDVVYGDSVGVVQSVAERKEDRIKAIERQQQDERNQLITVLNTDAGQAVFMRILEHCQPYMSILMADHAQAALQEGRRRVALYLIDLVQKIDPETYPKLLMAHMKRKRNMLSQDIAAPVARTNPSL